MATIRCAATIRINTVCAYLHIHKYIPGLNWRTKTKLFFVLLKMSTATLQDDEKRIYIRYENGIKM